MELLEHLRKRQEEKNPIRVGLVGCGQMGSGMVHVSCGMTGFDVQVVADIDPSRPKALFKSLGIPDSSICTTNKKSEAEDALKMGKFVTTEDALLLPQLEGLEAVVEATGSTEVGAQVAWNCILNTKHVVMLNVETDVTVGIFLNRMAKSSGCVYTVASGDEPGVCKGLYDFARTLGFDVVCTGKGKNNPIDFYATPESCSEEAEQKNMNPKMLAAFKDGSKTMVEMAAVSNGTGLVPDVAGMHGEKIDLNELPKVLVPREDGGILEHRGCVEYSTGKVAPGVFVIVTSSDPRIREDMQFVGMGEGPYYLLYKPYHLCNIEVPISVAEAVIYGERTLVSDRMVSEVIAVAKRDLKAGEIVGDMGGPDYFNRIYTYEEGKTLKGMPMGLAPGGKVLKDVPRDGLFTTENLAPDRERMAYKLRQMQDALPNGAH